VLNSYKNNFGDSKQPEHIFSPYRIAPLGAHVDHQRGIISGFAIDKGMELFFTKNESGIVDIRSMNFRGEVNFDLQLPVDVKRNDWGDYARGAVYALKKRFNLKYGINGLIKGTLPIGGLSSSAAVLVAYVMALAKANDISLNKLELIKITSEAEREYVGLNNGILDQSCVVLSEKDSLLYLDTDTEDYKLIPLSNDMPPFELGIIFSGLTRTLIASDYNLRVSECKVAAWNILSLKNQRLDTLEKTFLRSVPEQFFHETKAGFPQRFARRAEHFYAECERVRRGVRAWEKGDIRTFGKLIFDSCESSINLYECGSPELIAIYEIMRETDGVYGGRFSGAGFKGACICLVDPLKKRDIQAQITEKYLKRFPQYADSFEFHFCNIGAGARFI